MLSNGFKIHKCDKCGHIKDTPNQEVIVYLYVVGKLKMRKDIAYIKTTNSMLSSTFDMKYLGVSDVILGIKIVKTPNGLAFSQTHYIQKVHANWNILI